MQIFLEDPEAIPKLVANQYRIAPDKLLRSDSQEFGPAPSRKFRSVCVWPHHPDQFFVFLTCEFFGHKYHSLSHYFLKCWPLILFLSATDHRVCLIFPNHDSIFFSLIFTQPSHQKHHRTLPPPKRPRRPRPWVYPRRRWRPCPPCPSRFSPCSPSKRSRRPRRRPPRAARPPTTRWQPWPRSSTRS